MFEREGQWEGEGGAGGHRGNQLLGALQQFGEGSFLYNETENTENVDALLKGQCDEILTSAFFINYLSPGP